MGAPMLGCIPWQGGHPPAGLCCKWSLHQQMAPQEVLRMIVNYITLLQCLQEDLSTIRAP